tara:strand:- start:12437 stop:13057 length:621 start_codon:yes stop_codon:yes gene_type:complete
MKKMNFTPVYSVPLWQTEYPDFDEHKELFLSVVKKYKEQNSTKVKPKSNVAGYESPDTLHHVEELRPLFEHICQIGLEACRDLNFIECDVALTSAWLNVNDSRQCMNNEHVHDRVFTGVFYLSAPEGSGKLSIRNPAINQMWDGCLLTKDKNQFTAESIKIEPEDGNIIFFPSYLPHYVETNNHDEERISISFSVIALPKGSINMN